MKTKGVIFDLDGVIVSTDELHYQAWQQMADRENIVFNREVNHRLRGVSRMESLEIILEKSEKKYTETEKLQLAEFKNNLYKELLNSISPKDTLPGSCALISALKEAGVKVAIGSSSKNTPIILEKLQLTDWFDAVADGNDIKNSKPDPEVFLVAATRLNLDPKDCVVVEDADAGVQAAKAAGMRCLAVGAAQNNPQADFQAADLTTVTAEIFEN